MPWQRFFFPYIYSVVPKIIYPRFNTLFEHFFIFRFIFESPLHEGDGVKILALLDVLFEHSILFVSTNQGDLLDHFSDLFIFVNTRFG